MRREHSRPNGDAMVNGDGPGVRSPSNAHQSNGFTAVNGDSYTGSSTRPDDSGKGYPLVYIDDRGASQHAAPINASFHGHGWRPDDRSIREPASLPAEREPSPTRKRKRSISLNVDNQGHGRDSPTELDGRDSPKRVAASTLDSAIDLTSPITNMQPAASVAERRQNEAAPIGPYVR